MDAPPRKGFFLQLIQKRQRCPKHKNNLRFDQHKAERASFRTPQGDKTTKQAIPTALCQSTDMGGRQRAQKAHWGRQSRPRKPTAPNGWLVQEKTKKSYSFLPYERLSTKKALIILTNIQKWFYFCRTNNLAFHDLMIVMVDPQPLQCMLGLGLRPTPLCPTLNINKSMERFEKDLQIWSVFSGS